MGAIRAFAELVIQKAESGKEFLKAWYPKVEANFANIKWWVDSHMRGEGGYRHSAEDVDYSGEVEAETVAGAVDGVHAELSQHINNHDNPHKVTKAQIGLDEVTNDKQATKVEFDAEVMKRAFAEAELERKIDNHADNRDIHITNARAKEGIVSEGEITAEYETIQGKDYAYITLNGTTVMIDDKIIDLSGSERIEFPYEGYWDEEEQTMHFPTKYLSINIRFSLQGEYMGWYLQKYTEPFNDYKIKKENRHLDIENPSEPEYPVEIELYVVEFNLIGSANTGGNIAAAFNYGDNVYVPAGRVMTVDEETKKAYCFGEALASEEEIFTHKTAAELDHAAGSVHARHLAKDSVTRDKIYYKAVSANQIEDGAVNDTKIGDRTVDNPNGEGSITGTLTEIFNKTIGRLKSHKHKYSDIEDPPEIAGIDAELREDFESHASQEDIHISESEIDSKIQAVAGIDPTTLEALAALAEQIGDADIADLLAATAKIHLSAAEPSDWKAGDWWYEELSEIVTEAYPVELRTVPYDETKPFHIEIDGVTETVTNMEEDGTEDLIIT